MQIKKEIPEWVIDWNNVIFTLRNDIKKIDDVFFDWAIYTDFIVRGRKLILSDAPILSLFVDYETQDTNNVFFDTTITLWKIISEVYNLTGQTANSTNFNRDRVVRMINSVCDRVWKWRVVNLLNPSQIFACDSLDLSFQNMSFRVAWAGVLSENIDIGGTIAKWNFESLPVAWYCRIWAEIIKYSWNDKKKFLIENILDINHIAWEKVTRLYDLWDEFLSLEKIYYMFWNKRFELKHFEFIRFQGKNLLEIFFEDTNTQISVNYRKNYIPMKNDDEVCIFSDNAWLNVIANLVAGELMYQRNMPNGQVLLADGYSYLQNMYGQFEKQNIVPKNHLKINFWKWRILR